VDNKISIKNKNTKIPLLSVVIPTYNDVKNIKTCLESLKKQSYKNFEIIIADDGSNDNTVKTVESYKDTKILKQNHKGPGEARNLGARKAKGEILIFVDADMAFHKDYLKNLIAPLSDDKVIGTENEIQIAMNFNKNIWTRCFGEYNFDSSSKDRRIFRAIRKNKFLELGGFDKEYGYADDQTFFFKYGLRPSVAKNAICYHKNIESLKFLYKQSRWIGASIDNSWIKAPMIKYLSPFFLLILSPLTIPILSIKKCRENKDFRLLFPWMLIFTAVRYVGTVQGVFRKIFLGKNIR